MSIRQIATLLHDPDGAKDALNYAIAAARRWNAHLHVLCAGGDETEPGFYYAGAHAIDVQMNFKRTREIALELETRTRAFLETEDVVWDVTSVTTAVHGLQSLISDHMRFSDLAVLPLPYGPACGRVDVAAFEACLFGADIPVIVVPSAASAPVDPDRVLIAWDDSSEALAAARAATPFIDAAKLTEICVIDPPADALDRSDPGGRLARLLARSGAKIEVTVTARTHPSISNQLLRHATETDADLLVMGGYGHSRLREAVLGGVTRSILAEAHLPVLMAR